MKPDMSDVSMSHLYITKLRFLLKYIYRGFDNTLPVILQNIISSDNLLHSFFCMINFGKIFPHFSNYWIGLIDQPNYISGD